MSGLEGGLIEAMTGKAAHRFYDAKRLLNITEPAVLTSRHGGIERISAMQSRCPSNGS